MKKIRKITIRILLVLFSIAVLLIVASHYIDFSYSVEKINSRFEENNLSFTMDTLEFEGREVTYLQAGDSSEPMLVFVHGSPSDFTSWISYISNTEILKEHQVLTFNRLGYENNTDRFPESNLAKQAEIIEELLNKLQYHEEVELVGHSYGGPVIIKYAILYPERAEKLIVMGASVDPDLEPDNWLFKIFAKKSFRWILPEMFDISNREILPLRSELEIMKTELNQIKSEILILHGSKDELVPIENVDFMRKEMTNAKLKINIKDNDGHLFVFTKPEETIMEILDFCK